MYTNRVVESYGNVKRSPRINTDKKYRTMEPIAYPCPSAGKFVDAGTQTITSSHRTEFPACALRANNILLLPSRQLSRKTARLREGATTRRGSNVRKAIYQRHVFPAAEPDESPFLLHGRLVKASTMSSPSGATKNLNEKRRGPGGGIRSASVEIVEKITMQG